MLSVTPLHHTTRHEISCRKISRETARTFDVVNFTWSRPALTFHIFSYVIDPHIAEITLQIALVVLLAPLAEQERHTECRNTFSVCLCCSAESATEAISLALHGVSRSRALKSLTGHYTYGNSDTVKVTKKRTKRRETAVKTRGGNGLFKI